MTAPTYGLKPVQTAAPAALVSTADFKTHMRIDHNSEDTYIDAAILAATARLDGYGGVLGRALVTQSWKQEFATFSDPMRLPLGNLISVTSVKYYDTNNAQQTVSASVYGAYSDDIGPYLALKRGQTWPSVYDRPDAIEVVWQAGYGAAAAVPSPLVRAVLLLAGHFYANREAVVLGDTATELPLTVSALIAPYRLNPF